MAIKKAWSLVDEAKERTENLTIEQLKAEVAGAADLLLVDIREIQERVDLGTIPGSKHVPRGMLEFWADPQSQYYRQYFQPDRRTVLFCAQGGRSALAADTLMKMGFSNVAHLEPGFNGWEEAGEAIEDVAATSRWVRRK
ncbi:MAG: rhodanese-like domain-containing protein [Chloroflexi bacterium]|nr:rhodanese-like domain-containing protein [Chloroflexota bacterium]